MNGQYLNRLHFLSHYLDPTNTIIRIINSVFYQAKGNLTKETTFVINAVRYLDQTPFKEIVSRCVEEFVNMLNVCHNNDLTDLVNGFLEQHTSTEDKLVILAMLIRYCDPQFAEYMQNVAPDEGVVVPLDEGLKKHIYRVPEVYNGRSEMFSVTRNWNWI